MDREYVIAHNLVERYLRGELDEATREAFEVYYLDCPETLRELQLSEAMRQGLRDVLQETEAEEEPQPTPCKPWLSRSPWSLALAAGLAVVLVVPVTVGLHSTLSRAPFYQPTTVLVLQNKRSAPKEPVIKHDPTPYAVIGFSVERPAEFAKNYYVVVERLEGSTVAKTKAIVVAYGGGAYVTGSLSMEEMTAGRYRLRVSPETADSLESGETYYFRIE